MSDVLDRYHALMSDKGRTIDWFDPAVLRTARLALGLNQAQAAEIIGCTPQSIHVWESGQYRPRAPERRVAVAEFIALAEEVR